MAEIPQRAFGLATEATSWFACGSQNHELFVAQRDEWVDRRGAARRQIASEQRYREQQQRNRDIGDGIERADLEEQALHKARHAECQGQAD